MKRFACAICGLLLYRRGQTEHAQLAHDVVIGRTCPGSLEPALVFADDATADRFVSLVRGAIELREARDRIFAVIMLLGSDNTVAIGTNHVRTTLNTITKELSRSVAQLEIISNNARPRKATRK